MHRLVAQAITAGIDTVDTDALNTHPALPLTHPDRDHPDRSPLQRGDETQIRAPVAGR
jgi:hypothetical protein